MKYFVISDIHGFYKEMISALRKAGYKKDNPDHTLIVCGDIFDRGPEAVNVYKFLKSIPRKRRILVRGNHEYLLREAIDRGSFKRHDYHNKTPDTVEQFVNYYYPGISDTTHSIFESFENIGVLQWIFSDEWVNYCEIDKYIFVHSWIPIKTNNFWPLYELYDYSNFEMIENWREASPEEWEEATWGCPWLMYKNKLVPEGKTIVCGHWHTSDFRIGLDGAPGDCDDNSIYVGDQIIGLDSCTALSGFCNVFSFERNN